MLTHTLALSLYSSKLRYTGDDGKKSICSIQERVEDGESLHSNREKGTP
ncbi:hypothetical protein OL548_27650 [Lysinibacillus sp. MHQ-1]|nr:hypothetical protein OL548_27650 [Lysinibacillus sp. MHQ-1]